MPGRVAGRTGRSSKATAGNVDGNLPVRSRRSAKAVQIPDEGADSFLRTQLCHIFGEAQRSPVPHRKLAINLRKIQKACCYEPSSAKHRIRQLEEFGEEDFNNEIGRCLLRVLPVKKSERVGDRVVRFLGIFLQRASEEDNAILHGEDDDTSVFPETPSSRLTAHIIHLMLQATNVKDKVVRFRAVQIITQIINSVQHIDEDLYNLIRLELSRRLRDKEASVRQQAVLGFGSLAEGEEEDDDDDSDDESPSSSLEKQLHILRNDPSGEVRRAVLMNLTFSPISLKPMLERARDNDPLTRRALYRQLLPVLGDFRFLSVIEREKLIRWGLRDRDEAVRKATARLFSVRWLETCASSAGEVPSEEKEPDEVSPPSIEALSQLLERIDVTTSGLEGGMAHEAMAAVWEQRPDYREFVTFNDDYWNELTAETAFIARSFNDYCIATGDDQLLEQKIPEGKKLAITIKKYLDHLIRAREEIAKLDNLTEEQEGEYEDLEFIVQQLLRIALTLDYSDEIGRRNLFNIMREALALPELPEECTSLAAQLLRRVCQGSGEKEFISVMKEAMDQVKISFSDEKDGDDEDEESDEDSFHSAESDIEELSGDDAHASGKKKNRRRGAEEEEGNEHKELLVYAKCMHLAECLLQNVDCELESSTPLVDLLNRLIIPAFKVNHNVIQEMGFRGLGLAILRSRDLSKKNAWIFSRALAGGTREMKSISISTIADMLCAHRNILDTPGDTDTDTEEWKEVRLEDLVKKFTKYLTHSDAFLSQNACLAMCKLILHDVLPPPAPGTTEPSLIPEFLKSLTMLYFNPNSEVGDSPAERMRYKQTVQQTLSYCLPAFCHRRLSNALLMAQTTVFIMEKLVMKKKENEEFAEDEDDMAGWPSITGQFAEWTDPRKVLKPNGLPQDATAPLPPTAEDPHVCLAISILTRVLSHSSSKDEKKPMLMLLGKLNVASSSAFLTAGGTPEPVDKNKDDVDILRKLHNLTEECIEAQIGPDAKSTSSLAKVEAVVGAKLAQIEDSDTTVRPSAERASRSSVGEQSDVDGTEQTERRGPQPPAQTLEQVDEEEEEEDTMFGGVQAEGTRMPLEEEDEEEDDDDTVTGAEKAPSNRRTPGRRSKSRATVTESDIIDSLLESEME